jgi:hypothetical protein
VSKSVYPQSEQEGNAHTRPWHIYGRRSGRFHDHVEASRPRHMPFPERAMDHRAPRSRPRASSPCRSLPSSPDRQKRQTRCEGELIFQLRWSRPYTEIRMISGRKTHVGPDRWASGVVMLPSRGLRNSGSCFKTSPAALQEKRTRSGAENFTCTALTSSAIARRGPLNGQMRRASTGTRAKNAWALSCWHSGNRGAAALQGLMRASDGVTSQGHQRGLPPLLP